MSSNLFRKISRTRYINIFRIDMLNSNETYDSLKSGIQRLIDIGQKDFLMVHPLVITYNLTMGQNWYQEKYKMDTKEVPLDTFYLSVDELEDYIVENILCSRNTTHLKEDVLRGNIVSHLVDSILLLWLFYYLLNI